MFSHEIFQAKETPNADPKKTINDCCLYGLNALMGVNYLPTLDSYFTTIGKGVAKKVAAAKEQFVKNGCMQIPIGPKFAIVPQHAELH